MPRPYTTDRFPLNSDDRDFIPANPVIGATRDPNRRDPHALIPASRDRSIRTTFDAATNTLLICAHDIGKDSLNTEFKSAHQRGWRVEHIILWVSQDCWIEDMPFFLRNGFERRESLEGGTDRIALVRDAKPTPKPAPKVEECEVKPAPLTLEEITEEMRKVEAQLVTTTKSRSVDSAYLRKFGGNV